MTKLLHYWIVRTKQYEGINTLYQFKTWISLIFLQSRVYSNYLIKYLTIRQKNLYTIDKGAGQIFVYLNLNRL